MGLLDKKTRLIDMHLTALGRDLLSRNKLNIVHYAFSDDLVDYSGSLQQSLAQSASIDDIVLKNFIPIEATSMSDSRTNQDLQSFLYTCPEQRQTLPPFVANVSGSQTLTRVYEILSYNDMTNQLSNTTTNPDIVTIVQRNAVSEDDREAQYSAEQDIGKLGQDDAVVVLLTKS